MIDNNTEHQVIAKIRLANVDPFAKTIKDISQLIWLMGLSLLLDIILVIKVIFFWP